MSFWHSTDPEALLSTKQPLSYADRLRIRQPGDAGFALGPHVDGGSVERWEPEGYRDVYNKIWQGRWEEYDAWESSCRVPVESDLYDGPGACCKKTPHPSKFVRLTLLAMFRMFQSWLSMSTTGPREGTLMVNPLLQLATSYYLLRPFFKSFNEPNTMFAGEYNPDFLAPENWKLLDEGEMTSALQGASLGHSQELNSVLHPHLELNQTMVHIPQIKPGDFVAWHCDSK